MTPPSQIAHYKLVSKLGEGGMGAVYRATDTKLNRDVAIKILPPAFAEDAARMQRFEREAQVLASLNHPNIAAIYGIEAGAIVMELVEGDDLKGPVPIDTAIAYARQIAAGLEAAHEKGIIHRDLKPANIKVTPDGTVKLLDFGLAKASESSAASSATGSPTMSPTLSLGMTQAGMILGTAAYMAPEQARGRPVDRRADIWAFGVVFFEMLTGRMLFGGGETVSDSLAAVLAREPDFDALPAGTPRRVRRLLELCLRKDARQRLQAIGDARILLDEPEPATVAAAAPARRGWLPWAVAGTALAIAAVAGGIAWLRPAPAGPGTAISRFPVALPPGTSWPTVGNAAAQWVPSPDGRNLAFVASDVPSGVNSLWVRPLASISAHRLEHTEDAYFPFWSPDGQYIGFFADNKLKKTPAAGGSVQTICDVLRGATSKFTGDGATWNQEGVIVFAASQSPLMRVPAIGGMPVAATALEKGELSHSWPQFLPDGKHLIYHLRSDDTQQRWIYAQELGSAKRIRVLHNAARAVWTPPGYLLFTREGTLFAQAMDPATFQLKGEPLTVAQDVSANDANGRSAFAVSRNGVLAYRSGAYAQLRQPTWRDREGKVAGLVGKPGDFLEPVLSPDGKSVALLSGRPDPDVWVMDLATTVLTRITRGGLPRTRTSYSWSPDSQRLAATGRQGGVEEISVTSGKSVPLTPESCFSLEWLPDGGGLLCSGTEGRKVQMFAPANGGKPQTLLETSYAQMEFRVSPDGKYITYLSDESGSTEVYVAAFPAFAPKRKISSGGAQYPAWSKGGKEILYRAVNGTVMSVEIRTGSNIEAGSPKPLFKYGRGIRANQFAVTPDGSRFLIMDYLEDEAERPEVIVVLNWAAELKLP